MNIVRSDELALLDVDDAAGASGFEQQIGLAAKKSRDLQDIDRFGGRCGLRGLVNIGEDREACARRPPRIRKPSSNPGPR